MFADYTLVQKKVYGISTFLCSTYLQCRVGLSFASKIDGSSTIEANVKISKLYIYIYIYPLVPITWMPGYSSPQVCVSLQEKTGVNSAVEPIATLHILHHHVNGSLHDINTTRFGAKVPQILRDNFISQDQVQQKVGHLEDELIHGSFTILIPPDPVPRRWKSWEMILFFQIRFHNKVDFGT